MDWRSLYRQEALRRVSENDRTLTRLNWYRSGRTGEAAKELATALTSNTAVTELFLSVNCFGPEGIRAIASALEKNPNSGVKKLYLTRTNAGNGEGPEAIGGLLKSRNCVLKELYLAGNSLGDEGLSYLADGLEENTSLEKFDLRDNLIANQKGKDAIFKILASNKGLRWLYLWGISALKQQENQECVMNGVRQRCRQPENMLKGVGVGDPVLERKIQNYMQWKRRGRYLLSSEVNGSTPSVIWAHYLGMVSRERDLIFDLVLAKPDLFRQSSAIGQKRPLPVQESAEEGNEHNRSKRRRTE